MTIKKTKLGFVGMGTGTFAPFDQVYDEGVHIKDLKQVADLDGLVIWGGADISPTIYGEKPTVNCYADEQLSHRDMVEKTVMEEAIKHGVPIIGVCRGAQLACAIAGGKLVQDVNNHGSTHSMTTDDGRSIKTSSVHHQMMYPFKMKTEEYKIIAWSTEARSAGHYEGVDEPPEVEPEVIYFPTIKALAIQGHPEFMSDTSEFVQYCNGLVRQYLLSENE